jgi:hypothetical protein
VHLTARGKNDGFGEYSAVIDTPFASESDAILQAKPGAEGGPSYIWFDLRDGSNPKDAYPGVHLRVTGINKGAKSQRIGIWFYRQMVEWADRRGLPVYSDHVSVSVEAQRMYQALQRRGYKVERVSPDAYKDADGDYISPDLTTPVYRVSVKDRAAITEELTGAPRPEGDYQIDGVTLRDRQAVIDEQIKLQEEYDKASPGEQALMDDPGMKFSIRDPNRRFITARDMLDQSYFETEAAREMRKGFEAAARCAARHGAGQTVRGVSYGVFLTGNSAMLGQALGLAAAIPAGITVAPILARAGNPRLYERRRLQAEAPGYLAGIDAGLDAPTSFEAPEGGENASDLAFQAGEDRDWAYDLEETPSLDEVPVSEGGVKPGQAIPADAPAPEAGDTVAGGDLARLFDPIINQAREDEE